MDRTELDVTVVIPAFDAERTIGRVVEALSAQRPAPAEILVVDDASRDGTGAAASAAGATVIANDTSRSAGGARNVGWAAASQPVVVFLDADAIPAPGFGAGLARALEDFPHAHLRCNIPLWLGCNSAKEAGRPPEPSVAVIACT